MRCLAYPRRRGRDLTESPPHRLMSTNSLVLKSTIFPEWYQDMIQPWVQCVSPFSLSLLLPASLSPAHAP